MAKNKKKAAKPAKKKSAPKPRTAPKQDENETKPDQAAEPLETDAVSEEAAEDGDGGEEEEEETPAREAPPPKRTGRRGIGPALDPAEDFEKPVRREAEKEKRGSLLADNTPKPTVANGRMKVFYDRPIFSKSKDRVLVALQLSVPLGEEHDKLIPKTVADAHHDLLKRNRTKITLNGLGAQHASFYLSSDLKEELVTLPACKMTNVNIATIQRKGEGSARKVARLSFRLQAEHSRPLATFAELNLQNEFWLKLEESQETLWDSED